MSIETICPKCDAKFNLADEYLGKRGRCKKCNTSFRIARGPGILIPEASSSPVPVIPSGPGAAMPAQAGALKPVETVVASGGPHEQDAAAILADQQNVPADWNVGDVILDLYEVKKIHDGGGMGLVYRVHQRDWDMDMAVKSPRPKLFYTQVHKENFVRY